MGQFEDGYVRVSIINTFCEGRGRIIIDVDELRLPFCLMTGNMIDAWY